MAVVTVFGHGPIQLGFIFHALRQCAFSPFIKHTHQGTDNFKVA